MIKKLITLTALTLFAAGAAHGACCATMAADAKTDEARATKASAEAKAGKEACSTSEVLREAAAKPTCDDKKDKESCDSTSARSAAVGTAEHDVLLAAAAPLGESDKDKDKDKEKRCKCGDDGEECTCGDECGCGKEKDGDKEEQAA